MTMIVPLLAIGAGMAAPGPVIAARKQVEHLYGPEPSWEKFREVGEASVTAALVDPESARIIWLTGFHKGEVKPFLEPRVAGYYACGTVNARNRMGGYTGATTFMVVIDYDRVLYRGIDSAAIGYANTQCAQAIRDGLLPPAPAAVAKAPSGTAGAATVSTTTSSGLTLRAMPDGGYVSGVAPGSVAAIAGLKPGMVIGSVNAIPLAGMGDAMLKVIDAAGPDASVTVIGGGTIKLGAKR